MQRTMPLIALLVAAACGEPPVPGYSRETAPDGRVLVAYAAGLPAAEDTLVPLFEIGKYVDESSTIFADLRDVAVDGDGRIHALDAQAAEIRVYTAAGALDTVLGRSGEGPGEFSRVNGLRVGLDGALWVSDPGKRKLLVLDREGRERERVDALVNGFGFRWDITIDTAGVLWQPWSRQLSGPEPGMEASGLVEGTSLRQYKSLDPLSGARDSVGLDITPWRSFLYAYPGGQLVSGLPFAGRTLVTMDRHRRIWVSNPDGYVAHQLTLGADTLITLTVAESGPAVTADDIEAWRAQWLRFQENAAGLVDQLMPYMPETRAPIAQLFSDDRDRLWIQRTVAGDEAPRWDVYSAEGEALAVVRAPAGTRGFQAPVVRGGRIHLLLDGEAGERYIVVAEVPARLRE
jgi:hypothetical protein